MALCSFLLATLYLKRGLSSNLSLPSNTGMTDTWSHMELLEGGLEFKLMSLCLESRCCYLLCHLPGFEEKLYRHILIVRCNGFHYVIFTHTHT